MRRVPALFILFFSVENNSSYSMCFYVEICHFLGEAIDRTNVPNAYMYSITHRKHIRLGISLINCVFNQNSH